MVNLIVACIVSFVLGGLTAYVYIAVTGKMK